MFVWCDCRIAKTFCFSNRGHGLYLASPTEIQKFTIDAEFWLVYTQLNIINNDKES